MSLMAIDNNLEKPMHPLVSVVIPVFNKDRYLARAIQSVLDQTYYFNLELIIVDDGSTDNSLAVIDGFLDERIRVFKRHSPGPGGYAARNLGIRKARGDWIALLDADDSWFSCHLERAMQIAGQFPDVPIISAARLSQKGDDQWLDAFARTFISQGPQVLYLSDYLSLACKGKRAIGTNSLIVRRDALFDDDVFPEGRAQRSGDLYAWVKLIARLKIMVWSPHVASTSYRDTGGVSSSATPSITLFREMVDDLKPYVEPKDEKWLKLYANKMITYAWLEQKKRDIRLPPSLLPSCFFWQHDIPYCLKWSLVSLIPFGVLDAMHRRFLAD